jgi:hypothetical protein
MKINITNINENYFSSDVANSKIDARVRARVANKRKSDEIEMESECESESENEIGWN